MDKEIEFKIEVFEPQLIFTQQPKDKIFPLYSENQKLDAKILADANGTVFFTWYRKNPNETDFTEVFKTEEKNVEIGNEYETVLDAPQNNYVKSEYYCKATLNIEDSKMSIESKKSTLEQTVETGLPTVRIETEGHTPIVSKDEYKKMSFNLISDDFENIQIDDAKIKGRGNSSWGQPKKPYTIKLEKKVEILGM